MKRGLLISVIGYCIAILLLFAFAAVTTNADERLVRIKVIWTEEQELFFQARCTIEDKYHNDLVLDEVELFNEDLSERPYFEDGEGYYAKTFEYILDDSDMLTFQVEASDAADFGVLINYNGNLFGFDCRTYCYCYVAFKDVELR